MFDDDLVNYRMGLKDLPAGFDSRLGEKAKDAMALAFFDGVGTWRAGRRVLFELKGPCPEGDEAYYFGGR